MPSTELEQVRRPRVLAVDEDPSVLRSLALLLAQDCEVHACDDPLRALAQAQAVAYDVIVSDYSMPHMTGGEFARQVNELCTPAPCCVFLTGTPEAVMPASPGARELVLILPRPFVPERLVRLVLQVGRLGMIGRGAPGG